MQAIYQSPDQTVIVMLQELYGYYYVQMIGHVKTHYYRNAFQYILQNGESRDIRKILINRRELQSTPDMGSRWLIANFLLRYYQQHGSLALGTIQSQKGLRKMSTLWRSEVIRSLGIKIEWEYFENHQEAEQWIRTYQLPEQESKTTRTLRMPRASEVQEILKNPIPKEKTVKEVKVPKSGLKIRFQFSPQGDLKPEDPLGMPVRLSFMKWLRSLFSKKS